MANQPLDARIEGIRIQLNEEAARVRSELESLQARVLVLEGELTTLDGAMRALDPPKKRRRKSHGPGLTVSDVLPHVEAIRAEGDHDLADEVVREKVIAKLRAEGKSVAGLGLVFNRALKDAKAGSRPREPIAVAGNALVFFDKARDALAKASSIDEVKGIRDRAEALRSYLRQARESSEMQNQCAEIRLRAERRLGELLAEQVNHSGGRPTEKRSQEATVPTLDKLGISKSQSSRFQRIARIPDKVFEGYLQAAQADPEEEVTVAGLLRTAVRNNVVEAMSRSETYEWYTPSAYLDAARELFEEIDLDPASSKVANKVVQAKEFFALPVNGLEHRWHGRVWLNPPYGLSSDNQSNQALWSSELIERFQGGEVKEALLLVNAATDASWFQKLWDYPICFIDHRIRFERPNGKGLQPTHGNVIVYFGRRPKRFTECFSPFGRVVLPARAVAAAGAVAGASVCVARGA